jgi:acetate kinase
MDTLLVVNAGSSSVKFEVFALDGSASLARKIKGQIDGIGTRPRLRASGADGKGLVDRAYDAAVVPDAPAAMQTAGAWLREEHRTPVVPENSIRRDSRDEGESAHHPARCLPSSN